jgi:hypothetical protein
VPRNPHPKSIEEFEHDTWLYGPPSPAEEHRMEVELAKGQLLSTADHIEDSRALLAKIASKFSGTRKQDRQGGA